MLKGLIYSYKNQLPVEIMYESKNSRITRRIILIHKMSPTSVKAFCYVRQSMRTFQVDSVLAAIPVYTKNNSKKII